MIGSSSTEHSCQTCPFYHLCTLQNLIQASLKSDRMASFAVAKRESDINDSAVHEKLQGKTGLDLIWESHLVFAEIFLCFRECHA